VAGARPESTEPPIVPASTPDATPVPADGAVRPLGDRQGPLVALSTASVYPESTANGFALAARLGYDAVEVMVGIDPVSQDAKAVKHLAEYHRVPICAVHAPCLLITQRVWGTEPWGKLERSAEMAHEVGADVVVVHPPFRWQRDYARKFVDGIAELEERTGIAFAVENMYPWRASRREMQVYVPGWDPRDHDYAHTTIDLSHSATSRSNPVEMARHLGDRLRHIHMTDGTRSAKDEHLVPGRGDQPCVELLEHLAEADFRGHIVVEINTRRSGSREARELDLMESLAFVRLNFAAPDVDRTQVSR
jgi:sugar phosphate isomerase/epimerase